MEEDKLKMMMEWLHHLLSRLMKKRKEEVEEGQLFSLWEEKEEKEGIGADE